MSIRIDRLASLYFFGPLQKLRPTAELKIPILMYHSISDDAENTHPYYRINTSPQIFAEHVCFLAEQGYKTIPLHQLQEAVSDLMRLSNTHKAVVLTFDDGYRDFYTTAFPVLQKYGFSATVFLPTSYVGSQSFKGKQCLSWNDVRELHKEGILFGSHTDTHPHLSELKQEQVRHELRYSKETIEDNIGAEISTFSYPYRFPEENVEFKLALREALLEEGYTHGVTTIIGRVSRQDACLFMKRQPANGCDDINLLRAKLEGAYDWLHRPQYIVKQVKRLFGGAKLASFKKDDDCSN